MVPRYLWKVSRSLLARLHLALAHLLLYMWLHLVGQGLRSICLQRSPQHVGAQVPRSLYARFQGHSLQGAKVSLCKVPRYICANLHLPLADLRCSSIAALGRTRSQGGCGLKVCSALWIQGLQSICVCQGLISIGVPRFQDGRCQGIAVRWPTLFAQVCWSTCGGTWQDKESVALWCQGLHKHNRLLSHGNHIMLMVHCFSVVLQQGKAPTVPCFTWTHPPLVNRSLPSSHGPR